MYDLRVKLTEKSLFNSASFRGLAAHHFTNKPG
jgi:hypothetical protein